MILRTHVFIHVAAHPQNKIFWVFLEHHEVFALFHEICVQTIYFFFIISTLMRRNLHSVHQDDISEITGASYGYVLVHVEPPW